MESFQYQQFKRELQRITRSNPVKIVLLAGGALAMLMLVAGVFRVVSVFFRSYNMMRTAYYGE